MRPRRLRGSWFSRFLHLARKQSGSIQTPGTQTGRSLDEGAATSFWIVLYWSKIRLLFRLYNMINSKVNNNFDGKSNLTKAGKIDTQYNVPIGSPRVSRPNSTLNRVCTAHPRDRRPDYATGSSVAIDRTSCSRANDFLQGGGKARLGT